MPELLEKPLDLPIQTCDTFNMNQKHIEKNIFFTKVLPKLVEKYGKTVNRKTMIAACAEAGIATPAVALDNRFKTGERGILNLEPLVKIATGEMPFQTTGTLSSLITSPESGVSPQHHSMMDKFKPEVEKPEAEVEADINDRFATLDHMIHGVVDKKYRSLIISGNPGTGKTYSAEYILETARDEGKIRFESAKGMVRATGLYRLFWEFRDPNCVILLDDADTVFDEEVGLNLLKAALDTTRRRTISWRTEKEFETPEGEIIPNHFEFQGSVIFVTNLNFRALAHANNKKSPHFEALMSRSFYLDLNLQFPRELFIRIKSIINNTEMLNYISDAAKKKILAYMEENINRLNELSLRTALKLANVYVATERNKGDFKKIADATALRR